MMILSLLSNLKFYIYGAFFSITLWYMIDAKLDIRSMQKKINNRDNKITVLISEKQSLETAIKKQKEECINSIAELKQTTIKQGLEESLKEIEDEKDNDIKSDIGKHTLTFPK